MKKYLITIGFVAIGFLASCDKEEDKTVSRPDIAGKTKKQIFQMQDWRFESRIDSNIDRESSQSSALPCNFDDVYSFGTNNKISLTEGALDCDPGLAAVYEMPYNMASDNANVITIDALSYTIVSQKNERIVLTRNFTITDDYIETFTLVRN